MPYTIQEIGARARAKNPKLFEKFTDEQIGQRLADTNPNIKSLVKTETTPNAGPLAKKAIAPPAENKSAFGNVLGTGKKIMDKSSNFVFGSTSKTVGNLIGSLGENINKLAPQESAKQQLDPALSEQLQQRGKTPEEIKNKFGIKTSAPFTENINKGTKGKEGALNATFVALELYPGGGFLSDALKKIPGGRATAKLITEHIPEGLRANAIKQYSEALGATTNELKRKTEKVVPKLLDNSTFISSLPKFAEKAEALKGIAGEAVKKAEDIIPVFKKQRVAPIIEKANKLRSQYIVNGKVIDDGAVKSIDSVVGTITQFGHEIPETQLVKIRRVLDKSVSLANKNFTKEEGLSLATEAKEGIANSIRGILNSSNPKLGKANKEFSLWADVHKIVSATVERRSTQTGGLTRFIAPLIGGGAGFASGDLMKAAAGYFATAGAIKLLQSPAYKTVSALNKSRIANYLINGKIKEATLLTTKLLNGIKNVNSE